MMSYDNKRGTTYLSFSCNLLPYKLRHGRKIANMRI
jgi:hypothetical protein